MTYDIIPVITDYRDIFLILSKPPDGVAMVLYMATPSGAAGTKIIKRIVI